MSEWDVYVIYDSQNRISETSIKLKKHKLCYGTKNPSKIDCIAVFYANSIETAFTKGEEILKKFYENQKISFPG